MNVRRTYTEFPDPQEFTMHTHDVYELYCFLAGDASYVVEGRIYTLNAWDILLMKRGEAHSLMVHSTGPYERIVVHFSAEDIPVPYRDRICRFLDDRPLGQRNKYSAAKKNAVRNHYLDRMCAEAGTKDQCLYLTVLLHELMDSAPDAQRLSEGGNNFTDIIAFINGHLTEKLSLADICSQFYVSKSQLNRKFRQMLGTTVWEYISAKRLMMAKAYLKNGEKPTLVYKKCGFNDYCTFFKSYKSKFGVTPKTDCKKTESYPE